jgi:hypothetical protein
MPSKSWYRDEETAVVVEHRCGYQGRSYYNLGTFGNAREWSCIGSPQLFPQPELVTPWDDPAPAELVAVWDRYCAVQRAEWVRWCEKHDVDPASYSNDQPGVRLSV